MIKHDKVVYVEELTRLIKGNLSDKNIGSTKYSTESRTSIVLQEQSPC